MSDVSLIELHDAEIAKIEIDAGGCAIHFSHIAVYSKEEGDTYECGPSKRSYAARRRQWSFG